MKDMTNSLKSPKAVTIGLICQFALMPALAFALAVGFSLSPEVAIGVLLIGCAPGGVGSSLFTYFSKGDVALSITLTTISTSAALFLMPITLAIYGGVFTNTVVSIPYLGVLAGLAITLCGTAAGMGIHAYSPHKWAKRAERFGSLSGTTFLVLSTVLGLMKHPGIWSLGFPVIAAAASMELLGIGIAYFFAKIAGLKPKHVRTVALETGCQNSALSMTVAALSFANTPMQTAVLAFPIMYQLFMLTHTSGIAYHFRVNVAPNDDIQVDSESMSPTSVSPSNVRRNSIIATGRRDSRLDVLAQWMPNIDLRPIARWWRQKRSRLGPNNNPFADDDEDDMNEDVEAGSPPSDNGDDTDQDPALEELPNDPPRGQTAADLPINDPQSPFSMGKLTVIPPKATTKTLSPPGHGVLGMDLGSPRPIASPSA